MHHCTSNKNLSLKGLWPAFSIAVIFIVIQFTQPTAQETVILFDSSCSYDLSNTLLMYEDTTGVLSFDQISSLQFTPAFKAIEQKIPNKGFTKSAFWFLCKIEDSSSKQRDWVFDVAIPGLHYVDFYISDGKNTLLHSANSGFSVGKRFKQTPFRNPAVEFNSFTGKKFKVYTRIKSETPIICPIFLREKNRYIEYDRTRETILGLYFGAVLILALYHFYMFLTMRDRGYLWLVLFSTTFILGQMTAVYGYLADWGVDSPGSHLKWLHIINYLATYFGLQLGRSFINSKKNSPISDSILVAIQVAALILTPFSPLLNFSTAEKLLILFNIIPLPILVYTSVKSIIKGHRAALYFILATSSFILGLTIYNLMYGLNLFPFNTFFYFIPNLTFVITLSLYSVGLADKINTYRKEREQACEQTYKELDAKHQLQQEKIKIERELEQSRKMELIGRLLSGVAHDINNFLNPILGYSFLIKKQCRDNDILNTYADRLSDAISHLRDLTSTLLAITSKGQRRSELLDLNAVIEQVGSLLKHSSRKGILVIVNKYTSSLYTTGDRGMVHNAIINTVINAMDAIPNNGTVTISIRKCNLDMKFAPLRKFDGNPGNHAEISICDTGTGMNQEVIEHIFEPYFTTKKDGKGTGLGLANVYSCVKSHNGCINVTSTPGQGTNVELYFPLTEDIDSQSVDVNKMHSDNVFDAVIIDESNINAI